MSHDEYWEYWQGDQIRPRRWHPEGVYAHLSFRDDERWPLRKYLSALDDVDRLNAMMRDAHMDLRTASHQGKPGSYEKAQLRFGGLELLRDVDNEESE